MKNIKKLSEYDHNKIWKQKVAEFLSILKENKKIDNHFYELNISRLLWSVTEDTLHEDKLMRTKYRGQRYWSYNALKLYNSNNTGKKYTNCKDLRHDHLVPRKVITNILKNKNSKKDILDVLLYCAHAVVITKQEHRLLNSMGYGSSLPGSNFEKDKNAYRNIDLLLRYNSVTPKIMVYEIFDDNATYDLKIISPKTFWNNKL